MKFILCIHKKQKVRIMDKGDVLDSLTMVSAICKEVAEKIATEKLITDKEALKFLVDSISDSFNILY